MKIRLRPSPFLFFILALSFVLAGCAARQPEPQPPRPEAPPPVATRPQAAPEQPPPVDYFIHTVTLSGESLSIIAKWYTGDLKKWEILAEHNPTINPNLIHKGDQIQIPRELLVREDALTQEFVDESQPRAKRKNGKTAKDQPSEATVTPEGVPLFGPRDYSK